VAGAPLAFESLWAEYREVADPRSLRKPGLTVRISGANHNKPYPPPGGAAFLPAPNPESEEEVCAVKSAMSHETKSASAPPRGSEEPLVTPPREPAPALPVPVAKPRVEAPGPTAPVAAPAAGWLHAFEEAQRFTAEAHAQYQRSMAESHKAFLQAVETSFVGLNNMLSGQPMPHPGPLREPLASAAPVALTPAPAVMGTEPAALAPPPVATPAPVPQPPAAVPAPLPQPPAQVREEPVAPRDLSSLLLEVVAEKTGYPAEMLKPGMNLESDLGIDSIKRVEILSTLRERAPELPELDPGDLATLQTLGQIVEHMGAHGGDAGGAGDVPPPPGDAPAGAGGLEALLLEVVAEKTGYPAEMLKPGMNLESDLGIDSIKRVEILSTLRERAPELPELDPGDLATLQTLGQIVEHMGSNPGSASASGGSGKAPVQAAELGRYVLREVEAPAAGLSLPGLATAERVVITSDDRGVAAAVVDQLARRGVSAHVCDEVPADADAVVFLGGITDADPRLVHRSAFAAARAVAARFAERGGLLVTVQDTGGDFGLSGAQDRAWYGGLPGLVKTAAREWPTAHCKAIDLERGDRGPERLAEAIVTELLAGGHELEVGLHADGRRTTLESQTSKCVPGTPVLEPGDVVVASGGARGVTAACLVALAATCRLRLVLLGRTPLRDEPEATHAARTDAELKTALMLAEQAAGRQPSPADIGRRVRGILAGREIRQTLAAIRRSGAEARYESVDVGDPAALGEALDRVRGEWGPVRGLVHGAGVLADRLIADKTPEQFDAVFDTKVGGLRALLEATQDDPLKTLVMFSSVAGRCGNAGQVDYAMANEVLNKVASAEAARRGIVVRSLGWGPWEGGMVTPALKAKFESLGVPLIPLQAGARVLVDELSDGQAEQVELVIGGSPDALLPGGPAPAVRLAVRVHADTHVALRDHSVKGVPVLPVAYALEWFARALRALRPDLRIGALRDVKVLRGVRLEGFDGRGDWLEVSARQLTNGDGATVALELDGPDGARHYAATAELVERPVAPGRTESVAVEPWATEIYDGHVLFHGPAWRVIRSLDGASEQGISGEMRGVAASSSEPWQIDVPLVDGALQMALLWTKFLHGGASLPTALEAVTIHELGPVEGAVRCVLAGRRASGEKTVSDIALVRGDGALVAELRGVETCLLPGEKRRDLTAARPVA